MEVSQHDLIQCQNCLSRTALNPMSLIFSVRSLPLFPVIMVLAVSKSAVLKKRLCPDWPHLEALLTSSAHGQEFQVAQLWAPRPCLGYAAAMPVSSPIFWVNLEPMLDPSAYSAALTGLVPSLLLGLFLDPITSPQLC